MSDPQAYWENRHKERHHLYTNEPSRLAREVMKRKQAEWEHALDLGCSVGRDALFFAKHGLQVVGLDFSMFSLQLAQEYFQTANVAPLGLVQADIGDGMCFADASFDVVNANLSLHYFDDDHLSEIMDDIFRIMRRSGVIGISARSVRDVKFGVGQQLSERGFDQDGCPRYFFDAYYLGKKLHRFSNVEIFAFQPDYFEADLVIATAVKTA